jgi:hypothetical protein
MIALFVAALVAGPLVGLPALATLRPTSELGVIVLAPDLKPLSGVAVSLDSVPSSSPAASPRPSIQRVTDDLGQARFHLPPSGSYTLRFTISGFLTTTVGPFRVCEPDTSCCPMLESPLRIVLPLATCTTGSQVIP